MAGYKAHLATGILVAGVFSVAAITSSVVGVWYGPYIFLTILIGSFLPDIDSDTGMPVKMLFFALGVAAALIVLFMLKDDVSENYLKTVLLVMGSYGFVYLILRRIFNKFTKHRGVFHSLMAILMFMLSLNLLLIKLGVNLVNAGILSAALGVGYVGHLVLDELNSIVNLSGMPFIPNKSLGSALKIGSKSKRINTWASAIICILLCLNYLLIFN